MPTPTAEMNRKLFQATVNSLKPNWRIAHEAGITESRFSNILHQRRHPPSQRERCAIAVALGKPVEELFPEKEVQDETE